MILWSHLELSEGRGGEGLGDALDQDGGVQLGELRKARLGAVLAHVRLLEVKLRPEVAELDLDGVVEGDGLDTGEDDVLSCGVGKRKVRSPRPVSRGVFKNLGLGSGRSHLSQRRGHPGQK